MSGAEWQSIYNMSFNQKVIYTSFFILVFIFGYGAWYYKKTHPKYVPIPPREEVTLTIIPGWDLRDIARYLVNKGFASSTDEVYRFTGQPAKIYELDEMINFDAVWWHLYPLDKGFHLSRPDLLSFEGYFAPETVRVFADAKLVDILKKFIALRNEQITPDMAAVAEKEGVTLQQVLTMASFLEKEAQKPEDKAKVADILWRRLAQNWALQLDSTVHYAVDRSGDVFTTDNERQVDSPWNTYKYPGLPPGPIANPDVESIKAALYPEKNNYWYFLTGKDGTVHYGRTLEEHNANKRHL